MAHRAASCTVFFGAIQQLWWIVLLGHFRCSCTRLKLLTASYRSSNPQMQAPKNVLGGELKCCCTSPMTGYYRDGFCRTDASDFGRHVICAQASLMAMVQRQTYCPLAYDGSMRVALDALQYARLPMQGCGARTRHIIYMLYPGQGQSYSRCSPCMMMMASR